MNLTDGESAILEHIDLYGLTTVTAVARILCDGDRRSATAELETLVRRRALFRFDKVYTRTSTPPKARDRWRDFATLSYCCLGNHLRPRIAKHRLEAALEGPAKTLGVRPPAGKACIFDRDDHLARIWVEPFSRTADGMPLGKMLALLQRTTRGRAFQLWAYLALSGEFSMLVLCRSRARADELGRWLQRAPLVGEAGPESIEIPVKTAAIQ
ncbi:MAG: hypothetical protein RLN60_02155 [Phycisphaerales bacterium]